MHCASGIPRTCKKANIVAKSPVFYLFGSGDERRLQVCCMRIRMMRCAQDGQCALSQAFRASAFVRPFEPGI
eukprot:1160614-Pelagomonas_calceolata.AAC.3